MHDAVLVLVETFNKLLWKKPDMFKINTKRNPSSVNSSLSSVSSLQNIGLDCNSGRSSGNQWEHGEKISRFLRKVSGFNKIIIGSQNGCEIGSKIIEKKLLLDTKLKTRRFGIFLVLS